MMKKGTVAALFLLISFLPLSGHAAGNDNATSHPSADNPVSSGSPSYFEGVWTGSWQGSRGASVSQDVTVEIRRGNKEGVFLVEYSWEGGPSGSGMPTLPGSLKTKGREEGDSLVFRWTNKQGTEVTVTLKKYEENKLKARLEKSGPLGPKERPTNETVMNRR